MSERYKVFFCEETDRRQRSLRRYAMEAAGKCPGPGGYHNAHIPLDEIGGFPPGEYVPASASTLTPELRARPDWPTKCEHCDYAFTDTDEFQLFTVGVLRRTDTGEEFSDREIPVGGVRDYWWYPRKGFDGRCLAVMTPEGEWMVDSRANNCTLKDDDVHRCWVRHGRPEDGTMHVDKVGVTCAAGAGSILMHRGWHGFLHNGELYRC